MELITHTLMKYFWKFVSLDSFVLYSGGIALFAIGVQMSLKGIKE